MTRGIFLFLLLSVPFSPCRAADGAKQWIAVVAPELRETLKPLEEQRKAEGWTVTVLTAEADIQKTRPRIAELAADPGPVCVLLAGDFAPEAGGFGVPAGKGTQLRMAGKLSDAPWNVIDGKPGRVVETGRLPARNAGEAAVMVRKILDWPRESAAAGPFPVARLVAGHHGAAGPFSGMADSLTNNLAGRLISRLPAAWELQAAVHIDGSPWQVSGNDLKAAAGRMMTSPSTLLAYMGHSAPESPVSKTMSLLGLGEWRALKPGPPRTGLFFSCGCFTTELDPKAESFGFAAMRAPGGAAAVIGSHGETFAAFGYLAMCGLVNALDAETPPSRLGQLWHGTREGLAKEEISSAEFAMLDMSDGTGGRVPLAAQRLEHLESWMLLGDPAMPLLPPAPAIKLTVSGEPAAGGMLTVSGTLPASAAASLTGSGLALRVTFERQPGTVRQDLPEVPETGDARLTAARERRQLSENVVLAAGEVKAEKGAFTTSLQLPSPLPGGPWAVRVSPAQGLGPAGVLKLP
ncbi:MAG: C25 family cysteine peptidase [Verrucomicrobiota bacterium]